MATHLLATPSCNALLSDIKPSNSVAPFEAHRVLRVSEVCTLLGRSRSMLYLDMDPKSKYYKPNFPTPIRLSAKSIGWKASDIYAYINALAEVGGEHA